MKTAHYFFKLYVCALFVQILLGVGWAQPKGPSFQVIGFYSGNLRNDWAHVSFVNEANKWFREMGLAHGFRYDSTQNWNNLNDSFLRSYQVVIFLDSRPDSPSQRRAFQHYMEEGGGWMGFHFAGFSLTPSEVPANWNWYHNEFLGSGQWEGNTWRPVSATLRVENQHHMATRHLPPTFRSAPSEWYKWEHDLRHNPDIQILLSVDSSSFPLGTGPKPHEIWHSGYYPVVWTNTNYRMIYFNMGHNDIDYEGGSFRELSSSFSSEYQNTLILDALLWLGKGKKGSVRAAH